KPGAPAKSNVVSRLVNRQVNRLANRLAIGPSRIKTRRTNSQKINLLLASPVTTKPERTEAIKHRRAKVESDLKGSWPTMETIHLPKTPLRKSHQGHSHALTASLPYAIPDPAANQGPNPAINPAISIAASRALATNLPAGHPAAPPTAAVVKPD
ncbi:MAG: hypothetical protein VW836_07030, partial [Alphaproteobacteria bacterium]